MDGFAKSINSSSLPIRLSEVIHLALNMVKYQNTAHLNALLANGLTGDTDWQFC